MKIKTDFITNSSTCNYIIVGWEVDISSDVVREIFLKLANENVDLKCVRDINYRDEIFQDAMELLEKEGFEHRSTRDGGASTDSKFIVGVCISEISSDYYDEDFPIIASIEQILNEVDSLKQLSFIKGEANIISSMRSC